MDVIHALKWKIHDTLSRLGSLEDTFTHVYVYDLKEIHHYDHHYTFWDRTRLLQNNNIRCLKQFYDSLNDENEYALKWKIHDTLSRLGSLEDTFTQVYVYDLKEIHHYDHHNTFWDRTMLLQNNNICRLKQFYDSLNDEYQKSYSGTRRSLNS